MTRDEELKKKAEYYSQILTKNFFTSLEVNKDMDVYSYVYGAFMSGANYERKRSQILVEALKKYWSLGRNDLHEVANKALKEYGTQSDESSANNELKKDPYGPDAEVGKCRDCGNWVSLPHSCIGSESLHK